MGSYKELQTLDRRTATEAARLALLVTRQAQGIGVPPTSRAADQSTAETPPPEPAASTPGTQDTAPSAARTVQPATRSSAPTRRLPEPNLLGGITAPLPAARARAEAVTAPLRAVPGPLPAAASGADGAATPPTTTATPRPEAATARRTITPRPIRRGRRQKDEPS